MFSALKPYTTPLLYALVVIVKHSLRNIGKIGVSSQPKGVT
jgi:hypothetical protein